MVTRDGRLIAQEPNPEHPTGASLCIKGRAAPEIVTNPQRQLYPLKRTRPKGDPDPGWVRISWEEALETTARELGRLREQYGPETVAIGLTTPSGTPISDDIRWIQRFGYAFGTPNVADGTEICNWHKDNAHAYTFGRGIASPDFEKSACVVLWGHNPSATWLDHATGTSAARSRGAKLIVVDPKRVGFAGRADQWLRVRPGADAVLALGIAGVMIREEWYDKDFMRDWSNGPLLVHPDTRRFLRVGDLAEPIHGAPMDFVAYEEESDALVAYSSSTRTYFGGARPALDTERSVILANGTSVECRSGFSLYRQLCEMYPPSVVESTAWVSADQVVETARLLWQSTPVSYYAWSGLGQHTNATQTDRAVALLMALTGSFDVPGGNVEFTKPAAKDVSGGDLMTPEQKAKCIALAHSKLGPGRQGYVGADALYLAILDAKPYQIRGMYNFGRNFLVNHANGDRGIEALRQLEFFVHSDVVMTPTAEMADIFLPVNTPWERGALRVGFEGTQAAESLVQLRQSVVESAGESRSDGQIVFDLAKRLGFGDLFWNGDMQAAFNDVLAPLGLTTDDLRRSPNGINVGGAPHYDRHKRIGLKTQTGKIEVYSEVFVNEGQEPLPVFVEPAASPYRKGSKRFPLVITSAKVVHYLHGQHRSIKSLRRRSPDPEVSINPDAAAERDIADGDWVRIVMPRGSARMRAKLDQSLDPRVVSAQYGWWQSNEELGLPGYDTRTDQGSNVNRLVDDNVVDPISASAGLRSSMCEIVLVEPKAGRAWRGWRPFEVTRLHRESSDIVSFYLAPVDKMELPAFKGGQHITLQVDDGEAALVRCYSLSDGHDPGSYRISVKLARSDKGVGQMSGLLHSKLGAAPFIVNLQAPKGDFHLDAVVSRGEGPIVLVAAGVGITPIFAMLCELRDRRWKGSVKLLYGIRSPDDEAFHGAIEAIRSDLPDLQVTVFQSAGEIRSSSGRAGRISSKDVARAAGSDAHIYLCGPPSMIEQLTEGLSELDISEDRIHLEAFGPSSRAQAIKHRGPQTVHLKKSGKVLQWNPDGGSLLEQIERSGVHAASGCRSGQCESCVAKVVEGSVVHPSGVSQVAEGQCLPCVAVPLSELVLDL